MSYNPRAKLGDERESLLALGMLGSEFARYAAGHLVSGLTLPFGWETGYWCIVSALSRKDADAVRVYVNDWSRGGKPTASVSKFVPGDHYHCLGAKFDSLEAAILHLKRRGYAYGGMREQFVYPHTGD